MHPVAAGGRRAESFASAVSTRLNLAPGDLVVEVASNDGYLLRYFQKLGVDVLGVEPASNIALAAVANSIPTMARFFGAETARELVAQGRRPRLVVANNVVAHVPDPNDFICGLETLVAPQGTITVEFHHLLRLVENAQFDTIYHEHFQYFSLRSISGALAAHGLSVVDVEELPTQGGSLRVYAQRATTAARPSPAVATVRAREDAARLTEPATYRALAQRADRIKTELLAFLTDAKRRGESVVCFGAAAKGAMLLNYCGVQASLVDYVLDSNPHKQGLRLPGSDILIHQPGHAKETRPDYLVILPWNISDEIVKQMAYVREWGGQFVIPAPELRIL